MGGGGGGSRTDVQKPFVADVRIRGSDFAVDFDYR